MSFALRNDGTVFEWGKQTFLLPPDSCVKMPTEVRNLENIVQISAHGIHALALSSAGEIWRWGSVFFAPGDNWEWPHQTPSFPNPSKIIAGSADIFISKENEIWTAEVGEIGGRYHYNGKTKCIVSIENMNSFK